MPKTVLATQKVKDGEFDEKNSELPLKPFI
jgi:hypothetical protein